MCEFVFSILIAVFLLLCYNIYVDYVLLQLGKV